MRFSIVSGDTEAATASQDGNIRTWDVATGKLLRTFAIGSMIPGLVRQCLRNPLLNSIAEVLGFLGTKPDSIS